jgi:hypothetical protein
MDTEDLELRAYEPVPDTLVLAAVERAERHTGTAVPHKAVAAHLGFRSTSATTPRLRPRLEALRERGALDHARRHGQDQWSLTPAGTKLLAAARREEEIAGLPESPQHRRWRQGRGAAEERYDAFRTLAFVTLEAAEKAAELAKGANSETWFELGDRLGAAFWLMGSVTYCLREWPEPDDAGADRDDAPAGQVGRRNFEHWRWYEALAGGGCL